MWSEGQGLRVLVVAHSNMSKPSCLGLYASTVRKDAVYVVVAVGRVAS